MAKPTALAIAKEMNAALDVRVAALEARLELAREVYRAQRQQIADLESQLAARGAKKVIPVPAVTTFTKRDGSVWERTQYGTRSVSRCVQAAA